jgi:uncharacterized protein (DUF2344 family)
MPPENWKEYIDIVQKNVERLARLESAISANHELVKGVKNDVDEMRSQVKDLHDVLYKNGLSSKVDSLWDKKKHLDKVETILDRIKLFDKVIVGIIVAIVTAFILYFFPGPDKSIDVELLKELRKIEQKLDANANKN